MFSPVKPVSITGVIFAPSKAGIFKRINPFLEVKLKNSESMFTDLFQKNSLAQ